MSKSDELVKKKSTPDKGAEGEAKRSRASWLLGWVATPLFVIGLIFGAGVLVGAHLHESWFTRFVVWFVGLF
jgi:hypothetical protein